MPASTPASGTVLITGAARRLGRAIALRFAQDGWDIGLHYRNSEDEARDAAREIAALGRRCVLLQGDLGTQAQIGQVFDRALQALGSVDALVNNASVFEYDDALTATADSVMHHMMPNLVAPVLLTQALSRHIVARGGDTRGVAINLLDQKLWNLNPDFFSYTLSKASLEAATTLLAQALAPALRVVGVAPGLTLPSYMQTEEEFAKTHALAPLGRSSDPEEVARTVLFAAQSRAITGTTLIVDGGQHLMGLSRDFSLIK